MASSKAMLLHAYCFLMTISLPMYSQSANPFTFLIRSTTKNPVSYLHSFLVDQLIDLPCYEPMDGLRFSVSNKTDMAWYRRRMSVQYVRAYPTISDRSGRLVILEPIIGYNWYLCDTAFTAKMQHAKKYEQFYSQFNLGRLNLDWDFYHEFAENDRGQFKHHLFTNDMAVTEIFVFIEVTMRRTRPDAAADMETLTKPMQMGVFKLTLIKIIESDCQLNVEFFCENPSIDALVPSIDASSALTIRGKIKLALSNERLLKFGPDTFIARRNYAINQNIIRWNMSSQSIKLGALSTLNPYPLSMALNISARAQVKSDCVGSGSYLSLKYEWQCVLCRPGYYLKNEPWIHAASEKNSICHICPVGTYSNNWGSIACNPCPESHTTRKVGSNKYSDCLSLARHSLETSIHELLSYFDVKESADHRKAMLLAVTLVLPWGLFLAFLIISLLYGHDEVKDSESRFQLEKELGLILLTIRRNYNALLDESMRL